MTSHVPLARVVRDGLAADGLELELQALARSQARRATFAAIALAVPAAVIAVFAWSAADSAARTRVQLPGQPGDVETFVAAFLWVWAAAMAIGASVLARRAIAARRGRHRVTL